VDIDRALTEIRAMRSQIARGTEFRGYGPVAVAGTAGLAIAAALIQAQWIEQPLINIRGYLALWITVAALSVIVIGIDVVARTHRVHRGIADEMIRAAVEQMLPALAAAVLLTVVLVRFAPHHSTLLPGLWQVMLSLGVFASCRSLPAPMIAVALWYLGSGLICIAFADDGPLSPLAMALPFGGGQLLAAAIIQFVGESDGAEE
jgi:hypothetical protein